MFLKFSKFPNRKFDIFFNFHLGFELGFDYFRGKNFWVVILVRIRGKILWVVILIRIRGKGVFWFAYMVKCVFVGSHKG